MITDFGVNRLAFSFKIAITKLVDKYQKIENFSLSLHSLKILMKLIKAICKDNASEFK